jgi:hypothetical protein
LENPRPDTGAQEAICSTPRIRQETPAVRVGGFSHETHAAITPFGNDFPDAAGPAIELTILCTTFTNIAVLTLFA